MKRTRTAARGAKITPSCIARRSQLKSSGLLLLCKTPKKRKQALVFVHTTQWAKAVKLQRDERANLGQLLFQIACHCCSCVVNAYKLGYICGRISYA
jgi:hypothetical protein